MKIHPPFPAVARRHRLLPAILLAASLCPFAGAATPIEPVAQAEAYRDGRPAARYRVAVKDQGIVLRHGDGPGQCDYLGARDVWVWEHAGTYYMHYDGAGPTGWLVCLATSKDLVNWTKHGAVLGLGRPGENDSASASYGVTFFNGRDWDMFYLGTPNTTPPPYLIPGFPYLTLKAQGPSPAGPWTKQRDVIPFGTKPGTFYSATASPGQVVRHGDEYLMFFSASTDQPILRTLGLARTKDLDGPWTIDPQPLLPPTEQVENSTLYHDEPSGTWYLFTNHVGLHPQLEYTDAIWVYWSQDPTKWDPAHKAIVLDGKSCPWSREIIGLPSVVKVGNRLAIFYDGSTAPEMPPLYLSHMKRDIGLAWLDLPLLPPKN